MPRRYAAKRDQNEGPIVDALRQAGASVQLLDCIDAGVPDLLVSYHGHWYLMEVKTKKGKLNKRQKEFFNEHDATVYVVRSPLDALTVIGVYHDT